MPSPTDLINLAQLGVTTGTTWGQKYSSLTVKNIPQNLYLSFHQDFRTDVISLMQLHNERKQVTTDFKAINADIKKAESALKKLIALRYGKNNLAAQYAAHGITKKRTTSGFPVDNDNRMRALDILIATMSTPGHLFANDVDYGLDKWLILKSKHQTLWQRAKEIDGSIGALSNKVKANKKVVKQYQTLLRKQISIDYADNYKGIWRDFGFQTEKY